MAVCLLSGVGDPNGFVFGNPGDEYLDENGALWIKEFGAGTDTGWVVQPSFPDIIDTPGVSVAVSVPLLVNVAAPAVGDTVFQPDANEQFKIVKNGPGGSLVMVQGGGVITEDAPYATSPGVIAETGTQNDYLLNGSGFPNPWSWVTPTPAPLVFTGFDAEAFADFLALFNPSAVPYFYLVNTSDDPVTISHDTTSTAKHRVLCPGNVDYVIQARGSVGLIRNGTNYDTSKWQLIGAST